jgi:anaerobic selenocysteine-containing dehydrogenase
LTYNAAGGTITVEDSMSMVHPSSGLVEPPSEHLKSKVAIVCGIAKATLPKSGIDWDFFVEDYDRIRDKIEAVFPRLFANFNKRIRRPGGSILQFHRAIGVGTRLRDAQIFSYSTVSTRIPRWHAPGRSG